MNANLPKTDEEAKKKARNLTNSAVVSEYIDHKDLVVPDLNYTQNNTGLSPSEANTRINKYHNALAHEVDHRDLWEEVYA